MIKDINPTEFHFSGHDTFHLRYTWLPKAADYMSKYSEGVSLSNYQVLMTELGIGKNMANSLRHWAESSQLFEIRKINQTENNLVLLENDTENIIEFVEYKNNNKIKKYSFWKLLYNDE